MMHDASNTAALLTPPGTGAIAVIRITGVDARRIGTELIRLRRAGNRPPIGNALRFGEVVDGGETIDEAVVRGVGEGRDAGLELCVHGGVRVAERILEAAERLGARVVDRPSAAKVWSAHNAVEADAFELLPRVRTMRAARFLLAQRRVLPRTVRELRERVAPDAAMTHLKAWLERGRIAQRLIHGATVAIVGPPNVGKSQLFNALVGHEASVVSEHRGTTRDWVVAETEFDGVLVRLMDTAGRHESSDALEQVAINRTHPVLVGADACIVVAERGDAHSHETWEEFVPADKRADVVVQVSNKWDDVDELAADAIDPAVIRVSALQGHGLDAVRKATIARLGLAALEESLPTLFTERQMHAGQRALQAFRQCDAAAWDAVLSIVETGPA